MKNKRIENKISRWYGPTISVREWIAKHYHRFITYGNDQAWISNQTPNNNFDEPKGFAEMSKYCYDQNYGEYKQNNEG